MTALEFIRLYLKEILFSGGVVLLLALAWGGLMLIIVRGFVSMVKTTLIDTKERPACPECENISHVIPAGGKMWRCKKCAVSFVAPTK